MSGQRYVLMTDGTGLVLDSPVPVYDENLTMPENLMAFQRARIQALEEALKFLERSVEVIDFGQKCDRINSTASATVECQPGKNTQV